MDFISIAHAAEEAAHAAESTDALGTLGIDWKLFVAQLINFGVVLFILWKWVFTPVTKALQARTAKIEQSLSDAEQTTKDKVNFEKWKAEQIIQTRHEASVIVSKAQEEATKHQQEILHKTSEDQQKLVEQAKKQIDQQRQQAVDSAKAELADLVTNATEKVIRQKMDSAKDKEMIKEMLKSM